MRALFFFIKIVSLNIYEARIEYCLPIYISGLLVRTFCNLYNECGALSYKKSSYNYGCPA